MTESIKHWFDGLSVFTIVATLAQWMPSIAATLSVVWYAIRLSETKTVHGWVTRVRTWAAQLRRSP